MAEYKPEVPGPYDDKFVNPQGPGDARPTAMDIVKDNDLIGKLGDKVVLITGTSSGIGIDTAHAMAATGAKLFLGVRDLKKGEGALKDILKPGHVDLLEMDLNSLESIRKAADEVKSKTKTLNILINNAGIMAVPTNVKTQDGHESQFGTNHLAHFLLFQLLKPLLLSSSTPGFQSRVVSLSSVGHRGGGIQFEDYGLDKPDAYSPWASYGQAKTANIYLTNEIERRYGAQGLHGWSLHPGGIMTGLQTHVSSDVTAGWGKDPRIVAGMKSSPQGAATTLWAAVAKELEGKGGKYLEDCHVSGPVKGQGMMEKGYATWAYDPEGEARLWKDSCRMVGVADD